VLQLLVYPMLDDRTVFEIGPSTAAGIGCGARTATASAGRPTLARRRSDRRSPLPARHEDLTGPAAGLGGGRHPKNIFHDEKRCLRERDGSKAAGVRLAMWKLCPGCLPTASIVVPTESRGVSRSFFCQPSAPSLRQAFRDVTPSRVDGSGRTPANAGIPPQTRRVGPCQAPPEPILSRGEADRPKVGLRLVDHERCSTASSTRLVATEMGVSSPALYYHFDSKDTASSTRSLQRRCGPWFPPNPTQQLDRSDQPRWCYSYRGDPDSTSESRSRNGPPDPSRRFGGRIGCRV